MSRLGIEDDLRSFWRTRPHRQSDQRKVAGVAAAIARRYDVDPVLVRVGFIVLTVLGGVGAQLYLLCWLLLPSGEGESSGAEALLGRGRSSMSAAMTVVVGVLILAVGILGFGNRSFWVFGAVLAVCALWLLHHYRSEAGEPGSPRPPLYGTSPSQAGSVEAVASAEPAPARPPVAAITLGLAVVAAGICVALRDHLDPVVGMLIVLAVVCAGLVVGVFLRAGRWLLVVAVPLALATLVVQLAPIDDADQVLGEAHWSASTPAELEDDYTLVVGSLHLDLRDLTVPVGTTVRTEVESEVGEITVFLPRNLDVEVSCDVQVGEAKCLGRKSSGVSVDLDEFVDGGADGRRGGLLVLEVDGGVGSVEVTR